MAMRLDLYMTVVAVWDQAGRQGVASSPHAWKRKRPHKAMIAARRRKEKQAKRRTKERRSKFDSVKDVRG